MLLIEGQMFVFFYIKEDRLDKIQLESASVRESNKDGRDVFLAVS